MLFTFKICEGGIMKKKENKKGWAYGLVDVPHDGGRAIILAEIYFIKKEYMFCPVDYAELEIPQLKLIQQDLELLVGHLNKIFYYDGKKLKLLNIPQKTKGRLYDEGSLPDLVTRKA
jgi:hypothetical protein